MSHTPLTDSMRHELAYLAQSLEEDAQGVVGDYDAHCRRVGLIRLLALSVDVSRLELVAAKAERERTAETANAAEQ